MFHNFRGLKLFLAKLPRPPRRLSGRASPRYSSGRVWKCTGKNFQALETFHQKLPSFGNLPSRTSKHWKNCAGFISPAGSRKARKKEGRSKKLSQRAQRSQRRGKKRRVSRKERQARKEEGRKEGSLAKCARHAKKGEAKKGLSQRAPSTQRKLSSPSNPTTQQLNNRTTQQLDNHRPPTPDP